MFGEMMATLTGQSPESLLAELRRCELACREAEARKLAVLAVIDATDAGRVDGHRSTLACVRATANQSAARITLRRARLVGEHPEVGEAMLAGRIGPSQVDQIARAHANPRTREFFTPQAVSYFVERGEHRPIREFASEVDNWLAMADQDGAFREEQAAIDGRSAHVVLSSDEVGVFIQASGGDTITAEAMRNIFGHFVDLEFQRDVAARKADYGELADKFPLPRTPAQRRFDALREIFFRAYAATGEAAMPDPVVNIVGDIASFENLLQRVGVTLADGGVLDLDELAKGQLKQLMDELVADPNAAFGRQIRTTSGHIVHPRHLLQAVLTGWVRRVIIDARSVITDMSEKVRCFTGSARTAATLLHTTCAHDGCAVDADDSQIDHMESHADGGCTRQDNAEPKCGAHNRFKYQHGWRSRRADNGRTYNIRADGSIVLFAGERPPEFTRADAEHRIRQRVADLHNLPRQAA